MIDYKLEIISLIEKTIPELKDKIQCGAVDAETPLPFAVCANPQEVAIRTLHGIVGYDILFEVSVYHNKIALVENLKRKIISTLERKDISNCTCLHKSSEYIFHQDYNIHSYTITFKII